MHRHTSIMTPARVRAQKKPLIRHFIVFENDTLGKLTKNFECKSAAIIICWYTGVIIICLCFFLFLIYGAVSGWVRLWGKIHEHDNIFVIWLSYQGEKASSHPWSTDGQMLCRCHACQVQHRAIFSHLSSSSTLQETIQFSGTPFNPFTPKNDQYQNFPAASPEIQHHIVWRTWLFIANQDARW